MEFRTIEVPGILSYSPGLVRTIDILPKGYATAEPGRADFYDMLKAAAVLSVAEGKTITPANANEEQLIYVKKSAGAKELQDIEELKDYFGKNDEKWHAWEQTLTGLRFRKQDLEKQYNIGDKITAQIIETYITPYISQIADPKFKRKNFRDIIEKINKVKDAVPVPYCRGQVISEMYPSLGIFKEVEKTSEHKAPYALHGWLRENLDIPKDPISGYHDIAVGRWSDWRRGEDERCLSVDACYERSDSYSDDGFRPVVRGSLPELGKVSSNVDEEKIRLEAIKTAEIRFARDLRNENLQKLLEKYQL